MISNLTRGELEEVVSTYGKKHIAHRMATELLAAMGGEPVLWAWHHLDMWHVTSHDGRARDLWLSGFKVIPLYRHAQPVPVVPQDVLEALQKVARIRLDMNDFDGDRRGIADCLGDAEEALIEVVNRRAAMLAAAPQELKP